MAGFVERVQADDSWGGELTDECLLPAQRPISPRDLADKRRSSIARTIELEIIPRLMLVHGGSGRNAARASAPAAAPSAEDVSELARLVLKADYGQAYRYVEGVIARGVWFEAVLLGLVAPTARLLGEYWKDDVCDFSDVTLGLSRLQQLTHEFAAAYESEAPFSESRRRLLLAPAPGEQHGLGLLIVEEFFRRAGWDVWGGPPTSADELIEMARAEWFDVIGLSAACDGSIGAVAKSIEVLRAASRNNSVVIMVGGQVFNQRPELVGTVAADATAVDGRQAVLRSQRALGANPINR